MCACSMVEQAVTQEAEEPLRSRKGGARRETDNGQFFIELAFLNSNRLKTS